MKSSIQFTRHVEKLFDYCSKKHNKTEVLFTDKYSWLSIGLAASFFVVLYVTDELSYDNFHHDLDHLYRVSLHARIAGQEIHVINTCSPLSNAMVEEIPEVSDALRLRRRFNRTILLERNYIILTISESTWLPEFSKISISNP